MVPRKTCLFYLLAVKLCICALPSVVVAFSTDFHQTKVGRSFETTELYAKRKTSKQKIQRWGDSNAGGGFGKKKVEDTKFQKTPRDESSKQSHNNAQQKAASVESKLTTRQPLLTAAEYARLNSLRVKQQIEIESKLKYRNEYLEQQVFSSSKPGQIVQISEDPLLFVIDNFIDPSLCREVDNEANGCYQLSFPETVSEKLFQNQASELDGLLFNTASSQDHASSKSSHPNYPDGLHMDTNNQCLFRHVTCILYLNDVPEECGGSTVFPVARALSGDPALLAANTLLDHSISHTRSREVQALGLEREVHLLESRINTNFLERPDEDTAIRIQPKAGRLLVFFSRDEEGNADPRTWHAGERIIPFSNGTLTEKRILTLFKEVDYESHLPHISASTFEAFLAPQISGQRKWLQAKAQLQKAILTRLNESTETNE